jgi:hypothetical protein
VSEMCVELKPWQKEFVESNEKEIILNWCRGAGTTFSLMAKIIEKKPSTVLFCSNIGLKYLKYKLDEMVKLCNLKLDDYILLNTHKMKITYLDGNETNIYTSSIQSNIEMIPNEIDWIVFDKTLPYKMDYQSKQVVSLLNINNYDHKLQRLCPNSKIIEVDSTMALKEGLLSEKWIKKTKDDIENENDLTNYYDELELLSPPLDNLVYPPNTRKYDIYNSIPVESHNKFLVDTLINLQNEYDNISCSKDTVLTRKNLLDMIMDLQRQLGFFNRQD